MPQLWEGVDATGGFCSHAEGLELYLQRSKGRPVDVRIVLYEGSLRQYYGDEAVLSLLAQHASRWRRLYICANSQDAPELIKSYLGPLYAPSLQHLSILLLGMTILPYSENSLEFGPTIFIGGAPNLSVVRLQNPGMSSLRPTLRDLTTLHLEDFHHSRMTFSRFEFMLAHLSHLEHLSIYGDFVTFWPADGQIHLPKLRSLRCAHHGQFVQVLECIAAPNLHSLTLKGIRPGEMIGSRGDLLASGSWYPKLAVLSLNNENLFSSQSRKLFTFFPSVKRLELVNTPADDALQILDDYNLLCQLQTLMLHRIHDPTRLVPLLLSQSAKLRRPVDTILLHASLAHLSDDLETRIGCQVETWACLEPWPAGLGYEDQDDMLLRLSH
ncbi:hypothetical protein HGRIS_002314 [Hohenbuehelia grisea]|uniref:Uncharacterized protein n=1 Tax=Hohenbuehelia grisea TaxID=104357 RepID=A0ABR3JKU7_9AGAR